MKKRKNLKKLSKRKKEKNLKKKMKKPIPNKSTMMNTMMR